MPPPIRLGALARFLVLSMLVCFLLPDLAAAQEVASPPEPTEASSWLRVVVAELGPMFFEVLAVALTALVGGLLHLIARRLGVEKYAKELGAYELAKTITADAVAYAEQRAYAWAASNGALPAGALKLQWALEFAEREARARGLVRLAKERLVALIEARLGDPNSPGGAYRAEATVARLRGAEVDA
jgi:hypothetical protein